MATLKSPTVGWRKAKSSGSAGKYHLRKPNGEPTWFAPTSHEGHPTFVSVCNRLFTSDPTQCEMKPIADIPAKDICAKCLGPMEAH